MTHDRYVHFYVAENRLCHDGFEFMLHMDFPRCFIKYRLSDGYFASFDEFYGSIADVQWIDGERPDHATQQRILTDAWNFLALDEARLEEDLENMNDDIE